jgi:hypothetical protein
MKESGKLLAGYSGIVSVMLRQKVASGSGPGAVVKADYSDALNGHTKGR